MGAIFGFPACVDRRKRSLPGPHAVWCSFQRCVPVHGLAPDRASAAHGNHLDHETQPRGIFVLLPPAWCHLRSNDRSRLPKSMIGLSQFVTVVSWCTYPVVYLFPMFGIGGAQAVVSVQVGYCVSDIISKCGVGLFIYQITAM